MNTIKIINLKEEIKPGYNFKISEFYFGLEFDIPECLVDAMQILRNWFNVEWKITSTIRKTDTFGFHKTGNAIDSIPENKDISIINEFSKQCHNYQQNKENTLIEELRKVGINGFGIENNCIHLDFRPIKNCNDTDKYGNYCVFMWEKDGTPNGKSTIIWRIKK
jgi:hypothetical protein